MMATGKMKSRDCKEYSVSIDEKPVLEEETYLIELQRSVGEEERSFSYVAFCCFPPVS